MIERYPARIVSADVGYNLKRSGSEWFGDIPEHWDVKKLKQSATRTNVKAETEDLEDITYIGLENVRPWTGSLEKMDAPIEPEGTANVFRTGDVLFGKLRPYLAKGLLAAHAGVCSTEFLVVTPTDYEGQYLLYLILTDGFIQDADSSTFGAKMPRTDWDFIGNRYLPVPPAAEQRAIVAFLDRETARIDQLIAKHELLIERLAEYRNAVITRAVTKGLPSDAARDAGLDPEPRMKSSGNDWIGDVPEHWQIKKLKYSATTNDDAVAESEDPLREILYIDIGSIHPSKGMTAAEEMILEDAPTRARRLVQDGDTIVSTVRTYLRAVAPVQNPPPEMVVSTGFAVIRPREIDSGYCSWALREHRFIEEVVANSNGVSYPAINASQIGDLSITVPPIAEQRAIAQHLDRKTARIDALSERAVAAIERLNEYRTALITAAVTGKIDVREPGAAGEPTE